ncbi:MAG: SDR family oxidoreductase [Alphaproteobacteria bacterium]
MAVKTFLCLGKGYVGSRICDALESEGWQVHGTHRDDFPLGRIQASHVLITIPPQDGGDIIIEQHLKDLQNASPAWVGYLSATSVYGDTQGGWVDETSATNPGNKRGKDRHAAEQAWLKSDLPSHIFRLSGIYGPGRDILTRIDPANPTCINKPGQVFSRIHVDDIVQTLRASITRPNPGSIYNLADDLPASTCEVLEYACQQRGLPSPMQIPYEEAEMSEMAKSFYSECRRVRNDKIKQELGVKLQYPSYKEYYA